MNSLLRKYENQSAVDVDGWGDAAAEAGKRVIRGQLLKFADWRWTIGKEATALDEGTELLALACAAAWVRWAGGKPVRYILQEPGKSLPERDALDDNDEDNWDQGPNGLPRDPWQFTRFLYLVDEVTAEDFTFSTSSFGGCEAVVRLADQIARMRTMYPGAVPVVALYSAPMPTRFGRKSKPVFKVVRWKGSGRDAAEFIGDRDPDGLKIPTRDELDDEIPF